MNLFHVGTGSGGMVVLNLVAREPRVTAVTIVEPDVYKAHNVHRHLFPAAAVGRAKGEVAVEWLHDRRPELRVTLLPIDLTDPAHAATISAAVAACDAGVCAADNEPAKFHFDRLFREAGKPWTLGEVLAGGIGGWVHRFTPGGACYGCVRSHLGRDGPADSPAGPAPDYAAAAGPAETTIPASRAGIHTVASLHAVATLAVLNDEPPEFTSLLMPLAKVPGVFPRAFRPVTVTVPPNPACLICSARPVAAATAEELDAALALALDRLAHE